MVVFWIHFVATLNSYNSLIRCQKEGALEFGKNLSSETHYLVEISGEAIFEESENSRYRSFVSMPVNILINLCSFFVVVS